LNGTWGHSTGQDADEINRGQNLNIGQAFGRDRAGRKQRLDGDKLR